LTENDYWMLTGASVVWYCCEH